MAGDTIATMSVKIGADITEFMRKMRVVNQTIKRMGEKSAKATQRAMSMALTGKRVAGKAKVASPMENFNQTYEKHGRKALTVFGGLSAGIAFGLGKATKAFAEFDLAVQRAGQISGATAEEMDRLTQSADRLAMRTGVDSQEIVEGMTTMARMGFKTNKILSAMPHILDASIVSGEKFDTVLNVVESTLAAFNLTGDDTQAVVDKLTKATNLSRAKFKSLGNVMKYAAPAAHDLGVSLDELAAAAAIMIQNGKEGGIAGRSLRAALQRLSAPTKEAQRELNRLGITIADDKGNMRNFTQIMLDLNKAMIGLGNTEKVGILKKIFGMEASSGMLSVVNEAPEKLKQWSEALKDSAGTTRQLSNAITEKSIAVQIKRLGQAFAVAGRKIGQAFVPTVRRLTRVLQGLTEAFSNLSPTTQKVLVRIVELAGAFASLVAGILIFRKIGGYIKSAFKILGSIGAVIAEWRIATGVVGLFGRGLAALAGPVGIAIGALYTFFPVLESLWEKIKKVTHPPKPKPVVVTVETKFKGKKQEGPLKNNMITKNKSPFQLSFQEPFKVTQELTQLQKEEKKTEEQSKKTKDAVIGMFDSIGNAWNKLKDNITGTQAWKNWLAGWKEDWRKTKDSFNQFAEDMRLGWERFKQWVLKNTEDMAKKVKWWFDGLGGLIDRLFGKINQTKSWSPPKPQPPFKEAPSSGPGSSTWGFWKPMGNTYNVNVKASQVDGRNFKTLMNKATMSGAVRI